MNNDERMKLIQETVDCIRNTFNLGTESNKLVRNCMALVQNAIDGEYHDMEEVDVSKLERPKGEYESGFIDALDNAFSKFDANCTYSGDIVLQILEKLKEEANKCGADMRGTENATKNL